MSKSRNQHQEQEHAHLGLIWGLYCYLTRNVYNPYGGQESLGQPTHDLSLTHNLRKANFCKGLDGWRHTFLSPYIGRHTSPYSLKTLDLKPNGYHQFS